jgi:cell surface protein SprA
LFEGIPILEDYKEWKIYFAPSSLSFGLNANRTRTEEKARSQQGQRPIIRNFSASRQASVNFKLTEGGLLNIGGDYSVNVSSSLLHLETDTSGFQRSFSTILSDIFFGRGGLDFGNEQSYDQSFRLTSRPKLPSILDIDKYLDVQAGYGVTYRWQNNFQQQALGRSAAFNNDITTSISFRLKQLGDKIFGTEGEESGGIGRRRGREEEKPQISQQTAADTLAPKQEEKPGSVSLGKVLSVLKLFIKVPLFDYENVSVNFSRTNGMQSNGLVGSTGFKNFWRLPFFTTGDDTTYGPPRAFQLGLSAYPGPRVANPNGTLSDNFAQMNRLDFRTSKPLWEGARLELSWKVSWSENRNTTLRSTDSAGVRILKVETETVTGDVDRSFLTLPSFFLFDFFGKTGVGEVAKKFESFQKDPNDTRAEPEKLAQAFEEGFEALPFFRKIFGKYFPRVNWTFRWEGLEKLPFLSTIANRVGLEHAYTSSYNTRYRSNPDGGTITEGQRITYAFQPLLGLNIQFKDLGGGSFNAAMRYSISTNYDLNSASRNIVENFTNEISGNAGFAKRGFEIPLFGLSLKNDVDISVNYSYQKTSRRTYDTGQLTDNAKGNALEGQSRTTLEPRFRYVISSRVTASLFYRFTKVAPDEGGSRIPGTTTNEAGLDVHISIN